MTNCDLKSALEAFRTTAFLFNKQGLYSCVDDLIVEVDSFRMLDVVDDDFLERCRKKASACSVLSLVRDLAISACDCSTFSACYQYKRLLKLLSYLL